MYRYLFTKGIAEKTQRMKCRQVCRHFLPTVPTLPTLSMPTLPTVPTLPTCRQKCRHLACRHFVSPTLFEWLAADNLIEPTTLGIATLSIATSKASSRDNLLCTGHSYNDSGSTSFVAVYFKVPPTLPSFEWMGHLLIFPTRMYILCYWLFACRWPPLPTGDHGQNLMCPPEGETAQINMLQHFVRRRYVTFLLFE